MRKRSPLRSTVKDRPVFQRIVYSQCWEDPEVSRAALEVGPDDDLLILTSAGDNVLAHLLDGPRSITALDFSAAQNALLELKIAAIRALPWREYVEFLGARDGTDRVAAYRNSVRGHLGDDARRYFDARERDLAAGIIHTGRFQRYLRRFRTAVLPLMHNRATVEEFMTIVDRADRERYYDEVWNNRRWRALFTMFFGRAVMARLGRDPAFFRYVEQDAIGQQFLERTRRAMVESSPRENHFLQYAMLGRYPDLEHGPVYLRESSFDRLRQLVDRIKIVRGDLEGYLHTLEPDSLSALYLSDLFEWVSAEHHETMLRAITGVTRPGARWVYWNLLVPRSRPDSLADAIEVHDQRARELHQRDLAFVYGCFHLESRR